MENIKYDFEVSEDFIKFADLPNTEEYAIRQAITKIIEKIPMSELESIFRIRTYSKDDLINSHSPKWYVDLIQRLRILNLRRYEIEYVGNKKE